MAMVMYPAAIVMLVVSMMITFAIPVMDWSKGNAMNAMGLEMWLVASVMAIESSLPTLKYVLFPSSSTV